MKFLIKWWLRQLNSFSFLRSMAIVVLSVGFLLPVLLPSTLLAADCACFCGDSLVGAETVGQYSSGTSCAKACSDSGKTFVGCFENEAEYPRYSDLCWTKSQCESHKPDLQYYNNTSCGNNTGGTWGGVNPRCESIPGSGEQTGYCYGSQAGIKLNVPIAGTTEICSLSGYVSVVYRWLFPAMAIIAILMVTIGGFQYLTAGGNTKGVEQGKARIRNASLGILLLMFAYSIAALIDPSLVKFKELRVPLVKKTSIISTSSSCEVLEAQGFGLEIVDLKTGDGTSPTRTCGTGANIKSLPTDKDVAGWKIGDTCYFNNCSKGGETCLISGSGSSISGQCVTCNTVPSDLASRNTCAQVGAALDAADSNPDHKYLCIEDYEYINECATVFFGQIASTRDYVDCALVRSQSKGYSDPCNVYEDLETDLGNVFDIDFDNPMFSVSLASTCASDICGVAQAGKSCQFEGALVGTYVDSLGELFSNYGGFDLIPTDKFAATFGNFGDTTACTSK